MIERTPDDELGLLSLDELETLARNAWRRRLGPEAYERPHSRPFIRALLVYALEPDSPVRDTVVDRRLWVEIAALESWGRNRTQIQAELHELAQAVCEVLETAGFGSRIPRRFAHLIAEKIRNTLEWPEPPVERDRPAQTRTP